MATHNARQTDRAPFFTEIDVLSAGALVPRRLWGADVSEAGMFLQTTHPFRVGDRVALRFDVDDHEVHVRAAEVMWVRPFEPISVDGRVPGIGLRFVTLDPPARAALRRLVRTAAGEHRAGDTTLPERESLALPSDPPRASSAPAATHSMLARAGAPRAERAEELPAISMAPFTEVPRAHQHGERAGNGSTPPPPTVAIERWSLPPDEPAFHGDLGVAHAPAAVTLGPKRTSAPPAAPATSNTPAAEPFAGWTFRALDDAAAAVHESTPPEPLGLAFDDERPGSLLEAAHDDDSGPRELHLPALTRDDEPEPSVLGAAHDDDGALAAKPVVTERRRATQRRPMRALPLAAALLCSGALVGVGVGVISKRIERLPAAPVAEGVPAATSPMVGAPASPTAPPVHEPALAVSTTSVASAPTPVQAVATAERALTPVDVVAGAAPTPVERVASARAPAAATTTAPGRSTARARPATAPTTSALTAHALGARVEVAVGNARVLKTFTLTGPNRVVVDLAEATLPGAAATPDDPGVTRVRFGAPAPGTARVVVETAEVARQPSARVVDGRLLISFAS